MPNLRAKAVGLRSIPRLVKPEWLNPDLSFTGTALREFKTITSGKNSYIQIGELGVGSTAKTYAVYDKNKNEFKALKISRGHATGSEMPARSPEEKKIRDDVIAERKKIEEEFGKEHKILKTAGKSSKYGITIQPWEDEPFDSIHILMNLESGVTLDKVEFPR